MKGLRSISILALCILSAAPLYSQAVNATIVGSITDSSGAVVSGAKVTITETNTGIVHPLTANDSGTFTLPDIPAGTYSVAADHPGFKKEERRNIQVLTNSTTRVDLQLQPGSASETIEVTGAPPALQTDRADTGRTIDTQIVDEMPLSGNRNFQNLLDLVPGSAPETEQHSQFFNASGSLQTEVNGTPRVGNNYQIEGIDNNERTGLLQILIPPIEAIQSVGVSTTNHDPELGRATGAVVNVMLKSGTNQFHGGAYEFIENGDLNARAFFNPTVGVVAYNYFGGNIGGPIKKNRIFFFADYLRQSDHEANTNLVTIPSAASRTGDLSADTHVVYDPATGNAITGVGRTPFAGNIIPASRINPVSAAILAAIPEPNQPYNQANPSNNYFSLLPFHKDTNFVDGKVDYVITDKDRFSGRFSFQDPTIFQAPLFGNLGGNGNFSGTGNQKTYSTGLNYDRVMSPTLVTEFRFGVAYYHNQAYQSDYGQNDSTAIGIPGVNLTPFTTGFAGITLGGPFSQLTGYSASLPWDRAEANIDLVNSWTKNWKNHTIKWGADIRILRDALLQDQTYSPRGIIAFGTNQTSIPNASTGWANNMASFLLDTPATEGRDVNTYFPSLHQKQYFFYVADNWQFSSKLTLNIGLRWEYYAPPTPEFPGGFSNYNPANNTLVIAGIGGNPSDMGFQKQFHYFAPRVGLAYRVNDKTVIRSGFGVSYTPYPDNTWAYNYPVRSNNFYSQAQGSSYAQAALPSGLAPTFQNGFPLPVAVPVPANGIIANPNPSSSEFVIPTNYHNGYVESWNFAIQRVLPYSFTIDVAYVGNHGVDMPSIVNLNAGQVIGAGTAGQPFYAKYGISAAINYQFQGFSSTYNSLQVKLDRSFNHGFRVTNSFTWQKAMNFATGGNDDGNPYFYPAQGESRSYARADFDRTLNWIASFIYQVPFGPGKPYLTNGFAGKVLGGWQLSGIPSWRTGLPFTFTTTTGFSTPSGTNTAQQVAPIVYIGGINIGNPWFSKSSFTTTATNVQGNTGRNIYSGPDLFTLNTNLSRTIAIRERLQMQIRFECFNVTNTPAFAVPNSQVGSTNFGYITSTLSSGSGVTSGAGTPRTVQAGVRFTF